MRQAALFLLFSVCILSCKDDSKTTTTTIVKKDSVSLTDSQTVLDEIVNVDTTIFKTDTSSSAKTKPITLQFNLQKGKRYKYTMEVSQDMQAQNVKNSMMTGYTLAVLDDVGGVRTLLATYDKIVMRTSMGAQKIEVSSENAGDVSNPLGQLSKVFAAVKGKSFTMKVRKDGEILEVEGFDKIGEAMVNEMNMPAESKPKMLENFKSQFNNQTVKQMFAQSFNIYPSRPVKVGDRWEREVTAANNSSMKTQYTLRKISGNEATITATSKMDISEFKTSGAQTTLMQVDIRNGLVLKGQFEQKLEGQMKIKSIGLVYGKEL
jgi:hypothetical protein